MKVKICLSFLLYLTITLTLQVASLYAKSTQPDQRQLTHELNVDGVKLNIYYNRSQAAIAQKTIDVIKSSFAEVHKYFDYRPKSRVHFLISDDSQFANGLASVFPQNTVVLNNFPPSGHGLLSFSKDWIKTLVIHEYIHIVTLEMTQGVLGAARYLVGSTAKLAGIIPKWLSEGVATWGESFFSNEGRLRNPWAKKLLIEMMNDPKACRKISCLDYFEVHPYGSSPYIMGAFFLDYLERKKPSTIRCIFQKNSKRLPFFLSGVFKKCTGKSAQSSLDDFINSLKQFKTKKTILSKIEGYWLEDHGTLENDKYLVAVFNLSEDARSESKREKALVVYSKKTNSKNKFKVFRLKYNLEKIYWHSYQDQEIALTFLKGLRREHYIYRFNSDGSLKEEKQILNGVYQIKAIPEVKEINYSNSTWTGLKPLEQLQQGFLSEDQDLESHQNQFNDARPVLQDKEYSGLRYWRLNYLSFLASFSGDLFFTQVNTKLSDPLEHHALELAVDFYQDVSDTSPVAGSAFYTYSAIRNWQLSLGYSQSLSRVAAQARTNKYESFTGAISRSISNHSLTFSASRVLESDFLSAQTRENLVSRFQWGAKYNASRIRAFVQSLNYSLSPSFTRVENLDAQFWGARASISTQLRLASRLSSSIKAHYGKLFKDTIVDGALYLGGANSTLTGQYPFPAYSLGFQGGFGNEVLSSRFELKLNVARPGWGHGFFPLRLNDLSILGGVEYLKADFLQDGVNQKLNSQLASIYGGVEMNFSLAYNFPLTLKLIMSKTQDDLLDNQQFLLLLDTPLLP